MNREQEAVQHFHRLINAPIVERPAIPDITRLRLRAELIREEGMEFAEALGLQYFDDDPEGWFHLAGEPTPNLVEAADALGDLLVVVYGAAIELGIDLEPVFWEIHRSNMSKGGGPVRGDGKALKGSNFQPPDLEPIIERQQSKAQQRTIFDYIGDPGDESDYHKRAIAGWTSLDANAVAVTARNGTIGKISLPVVS